MKLLKWMPLVVVAAAIVIIVILVSRGGTEAGGESGGASASVARTTGADSTRGESGSSGGEAADDDRFSLEQTDLDIKDVVEVFEKAFEAKDPSIVLTIVTDDFRGSLFSSLLEVPEGGGIAESDTHGAAEVTAPDAAAFAKGLESLFGKFSYIYDSFFKAKQYLEVEPEHIKAKVKQDLRGKRTDGVLHQDFVYWEMDFVKTDEGWRVRRADVKDRHQLVTDAPLFREVTTSAGLFMKEPPERAIQGVDNIYRKEQDFANYDYGGVAAYDVDGDGDVDIFMPNAYGDPALFINRGDGTFVDEASQRGLRTGGGMRGAVFGDVDNDGDPDLFIARSIFHHPDVYHQSNLFYQNVGDGRFEDRTLRAGLRNTTPSMTATFLDYDLDGYLDLFVGCYGIGSINHQFHADNAASNLLYRNKGDGTFEDVSEKAGISKETFWSYAVGVVDLEKDGDLDIYVANDYGPNQFYRNNGDGTFTDVAEDLGIVDVGNGMGVSFVDRNQDGAWDLYVTNMQSGTGQRVLTTMKDMVDEETFKNLWKLTLGNTFFQSDGKGGFESVAQDLGIANCQWSWHGDFADFDADCDLDLLVLNGYFSGARAKDC